MSGLILVISVLGRCAPSSAGKIATDSSTTRTCSGGAIPISYEATDFPDLADIRMHLGAGHSSRTHPLFPYR